MKKLNLLLITTLLVAACLYGCHSNNDPVHKNLLDLSARDTSVSPAQDFFEYANGNWLKTAKIPADKVVLDPFNVKESLNNRIKTIMDSCAKLKDPEEGSPVQQIGDLYVSAMDSSAIDQAGLSPLQADLDSIKAIKTSTDIINELAREYKNGDWSWDWYHLVGTPSGAGQLFYLFVYTDDKNSNITRVHFNQGGLGLPNKTYYFKTDSTSKNIIKFYQQSIAKILSLSGDSAQAQKDAKAIFSLEKKLAKASKTPVELRNPQANYHLMTVSEMNTLAPNMDWNNLLNTMDIQTDTLLVGQPEFYKTLSELLKSEPITVWKKYLTFHLIGRYAPWLSKPFEEVTFDFIKKLTGQEKQKARWKRVADLTNGTLGDALGQLYVKRYFPPSSKAYMMNLVDNLKAAYRKHIKGLDWMSDSTKAKALDKLNAIVKKIGYPDHWKDYSSITIDRGSLIGNLKRIGQWYFHYDMDELHKPVDRSEWFMTPTTINAYYNPTSNDINFPAGILQPPFYFQHGDDALNYGGIGMVIGHEMTHGFDDQGSQYDKDGNLKSWWTKTDRKKFENRAERVVQEYNNYTIQDSIHVNGKLTEGENIADIGGLAIAYSAFKKTKEGQSDTLINGLKPDQRFFLSLAQIWRVKIRPQTMQTLINTDPHSPPKYRVNGPVSNLPAFYKAFNVKPGDKMYRLDSLRVHIW
jgi:putative endopeptidase